jgi:hypothetical protein
MYNLAVAYAVPPALDRSVARLLPPALPWATALNATTSSGDICITLLALDVVGDVLRLTALLQMLDSPGIRVATAPSLEVAFPDGTRLSILDSHVLPHGQTAWLSWTYERPGILPESFRGTIGHVEFAYRAGGNRRLDVAGPWDFSCTVQPPSCPASAADAGGWAWSA